MPAGDAGAAPGPVRRARLAGRWQRGVPAPVGILLAPAALCYRGAVALHRAAYAVGLRRTRRLPCRVVAVGNLTVGGTGKTALVELLARALAGRGRRVAIVSRGYGGRAPGPAAVVSDGRRAILDAAQAGDEPVLLARRLADVSGGVPVVVGRDRFHAGALALERFGADLLILDDGFQHRRLHKDVEILCLDGRAPWGPGGLLPRGSLRESPDAVRRAHLLVVTRAEASRRLAEIEAELARRAPGVPIARAAYRVTGVRHLTSGERRPLESLRQIPALAFAGIAVPEAFEETLAGCGIAPREIVPFPDHHAYRTADLSALAGRARKAGAQVLLTTDKDGVRLPDPSRWSAGLEVWIVEVRLELTDPGGVWWSTLTARLDRP
jgi:tetraacyldisaccharide 4'-kinase